MARALGLASYKEARTKTFFLEQLSRSALRTTATGEPNTAFYLQFPALSEFLEQPNTFQAVNHYFSTDGDFAAEPIFQLTAMALNTTIDLESLGTTLPATNQSRAQQLMSSTYRCVKTGHAPCTKRSATATFASCHSRMAISGESAGKRAAAGPGRPALNRHRGAGRRATFAQRPPTPGSSPPSPISPPRATAGQAPSTASLDFQPEAVYWFNQMRMC